MISAKIISEYKNNEGHVHGYEIQYPDGRTANVYRLNMIKALKDKELVLSNARLSEDEGDIVILKRNR